MEQRLNCVRLVVTSTTFFGAIALGYLFVSNRSKLSRRWVTDHLTETADWIDLKGRETIAQSINQVQQFRGNVKQRINRHVPNLYEATEYIGLSKSDILGA